MFAVFAALAFLTGCCCKKSYNIAFLGDIHYDRAELHDGEVYKKFNPKVPLAKGVLNKDGLYSWRSQTNWVNESLGHNFASIKQNVKMWEKDTPMLLDNAAKTAKEAAKAEFREVLGYDATTETYAKDVTIGERYGKEKTLTWWIENNFSGI